MRITIPSKLRVGCIDYKIIWEDEIEGDRYLGFCDEVQGVIKLSPRIPNDDQRLLTFLHEVTHAILYNVPFDHFLDRDIDPSDFNEYLTDRISREALAIIKDNAHHEKTQNHTHTPRKTLSKA